ncbi:uncharacterized protein LOC113295885 [Papaver somniferum]|uniref:uncharacterized protein LOC113295885 n=1 Tax=Papaver somniferum TaxID=3469 RepID=UPI000E6FF05E|nr:uncharacterized protein LOC113295885 [Papaver somniferum]
MVFGFSTIKNPLYGQMFDINELPVADNNEDRRIWSFSITGDFTVASAVEAIRRKYPKLQWTKKRNDEENLEHILWNCKHSEIVWKWLGDMFCFKHPRSFEDIFKFVMQKSFAVKEIWLSAAFITLRELLFLRNKCVFENESFNEQSTKTRILKLTAESEVRMKGKMWNSFYDLQILKLFNMSRRRTVSTRIQEIYFLLPVNNQILLCCDGASKGNPGMSGYGFVGRTSNGECIVAMAGGLGVATNYFAEVMALLCAEEWAIKNGKLEVIFRIDSKAVIKAFTSGHIPWFAVTRWSKITERLQSWCFIHSYREVNFSADFMAKKGANMARGENLLFKG